MHSNWLVRRKRSIRSFVLSEASLACACAHAAKPCVAMLCAQRQRSEVLRLVGGQQVHAAEARLCRHAPVVRLLLRVVEVLQWAS